MFCVDVCEESRTWNANCPFTRARERLYTYTITYLEKGRHIIGVPSA